MKTAQADAYVSTAKPKPPPPWKEAWPEHDSPEWLRLLQGIGPEDIDALETVSPNIEWAHRIYMSPKEIKNLEKLWRQSSKLTKSLARKGIKSQNAKTRSPKDGGLASSLESPRPVVTYIWRDNYKRSVLNTHDLLSYILLRYNVTLRVTTLQV